MNTDHTSDLAQRARDVIDSNHYMTLGTSESDGRPRLSPVYFNHAGYRDFYWVSSPEAHHSRNIADRPEVAIVIYDSTAPVGEGKAVYLAAQAMMVDEADLAEHCALAFTHLRPGATAFTPHEFSGEAGLRLYLARATRHEVHIRGRDPVYGKGIDTRREVEL